MTPPTEENFTPFPNMLIEQLYQINLSAYQTRTLLYLIRKTLGWQKETDWISQSQFAKDISLDRRHVHRALKQLEDAKIIVIQRGDKKRARYGIQRDFRKWKPELLKRSVIQRDDKKDINTRSKKNFKPTSLSSNGATNKKVVTQRGDNLSSHGAYTKEILTKENVYTPSSDGEHSKFPIIKSKKGKTLKGWQLNGFMQFWETFNYKVGRAQAADVWLGLDVTPEVLPDILKGAHRESVARPEKIRKGLTPKMPQGWLSERRWEDEAVIAVNSHRHERPGPNANY